MKKIVAEPYRDIDFTGAKQGAVLPLEAGKTKISIRLDNKVIEDFRAQVERAGTGSYQTLINDALVAFIQQRSMIDAVRQVVREELPRLRKNFHVLASDRESRTAWIPDHVGDDGGCRE
jgi:uncharacterized protein (DUF4415 family)